MYLVCPAAYKNKPIRFAEDFVPYGQPVRQRSAWRWRQGHG
jgi:hypothetical protein